MGDRQAKRPLEQGDNRIPVGQSANGGGFGKCRHKGQRGKTGLKAFCGKEHDDAQRQRLRCKEM